MPIISAFFGIVIRMYYKEHEPPHFHAEHAQRRIREWAQIHRDELDANWVRMKAGQPLESIAPLSSEGRP
jgi:hypothetical protein